MIEEATLAPDDERIVAIPIQNYSCEPLCLEPGEVLGQVQPVTIVFDPTPLVEDAIAFENVFDGNKRVRCNSGECVGSGGVAVAAVIGEDDNASGVSREARLLQNVHVDDKLTPQESGQLSDLIAEFSDVFALDQCELSSTDVVTHVIDTGDSIPIKQHPRRIPFSLRSRVDQLVSEMLDQGIVVPSKSPWASPVVLVAKKDGSTRFLRGLPAP